MNRHFRPTRIFGPSAHPRLLTRVGALAGLPLLFLLAACSGDESQNVDQSAAPAVSVARPVVRTIVEFDDYTGRFQAVESVEIRARVSGYLDEVKFTPGEFVEKDQVLFVIDQRPFEAARDGARADVASAEAQLKLAENELARAEPLLKRGNLSQSDFDSRVQERNVAAANLKRSQASLRRAELDFEFTEVRAPVRGRISRERVTVGNLVTGGTDGATVLTSIVSLDPIHFYFTVSEQDYLKYLRLARMGDRPSAREGRTAAWVRLADEEDFSRRGHIDFVDNQLSTSTGTISGRAVFDNPDLLLTPGLFGRIRLPGSGEYEAVLIPDAAIGSDQTDKFVLVVTEDDSVERRPVTLGKLYSGLRIIRSGLTGDDRIIVAGLQRVRPGSPVTVEETTIDFTETAMDLTFDPQAEQAKATGEAVPATDQAGADSGEAETGEGEAVAEIAAEAEAAVPPAAQASEATQTPTQPDEETEDTP